MSYIGLDANYGLFTSTPDGLAYPNPAAERIPGGLALLEFMGACVRAFTAPSNKAMRTALV